MMQSLIITGPEQCELREVPIPTPGPGQALVRVDAVTTCPHWDMHILGGEPMFANGTLEYPYTPGQPGHEACGEIVSVGPGAAPFVPGMRVCVWRDSGHAAAGCYAGYVVKSIADLIEVPREGAAEHWAPLELAMCVSVHVMFAERLNLIEGCKVAVFGLGPAGLICLQLARAAGAGEVLAFDLNAERRALALSLGAAAAFDPRDADFAALPPRRTPGAIDTSFDCVGLAPVVQQAMNLSSKLVVLFAVQRQPYVFEPRHWANLVLAGAQPHGMHGAQYAVDRIREGRLNLAPLVTRTLRLEQYAEGVAMLRRQEAIKLAFLPEH